MNCLLTNAPSCPKYSDDVQWDPTCWGKEEFCLPTKLHVPRAMSSTFAPRHLVSALNAFGLFARQLARAGTRIRVGCRWHALRVVDFLYGGLRDAQ